MHRYVRLEPCKWYLQGREVVFHQLINNFNTLVLEFKKIITIVSIGLISTLVVYGSIFEGQILRITPSFKEKEVYTISPQLQI
jgi:hypothetical protein